MKDERITVKTNKKSQRARERERRDEKDRRRLLMAVRPVGDRERPLLVTNGLITQLTNERREKEKKKRADNKKGDRCLSGGGG